MNEGDTVSDALKNHPYAQTIWNELMKVIKNEKGVSALMGNLQAESGLYPDRVQGDVPYSNYSKEYTQQVDSGAISKDDFIYNGPNGGGYGLAQWTYWSRKKEYYESWKSWGYDSIGNVNLACDFLIVELRYSFPTILSALENATSIREASDIVLHDFEAPADQSESVEKLRAEMGQEIYDTFANGGGGGGGGGSTGSKEKQLSKLLLFAIATDII